MFTMNKNLVFSFIGGAVFTLVIAILYFTMFASKRSFPSFEDGKYFANIEWEDLRGEALPNSFLLEKDEARFSLFFSYPHAEEISGSLVGMEEAIDRFEPLQIQSASGSFLLFGDISDLTSKRGVILEVSSGREGAWELSTLNRYSEDSVEDTKETSLHLALLLEEAYVTSRLERNQIQVQGILAETQSLEEKLDSVEKLRSEGQQRIQEIETTLSKVVSEKESELKKIIVVDTQLLL